jgi:TonB family protein
MKTTLTCFFALLFSGFMYCQNELIETVYLDSIGRTVAKGNHDFYETLTHDTAKNTYLKTRYSKLDRKFYTSTFKDKECKTKEGEHAYYYENGNRQSVSFYKENSLTGKLTEWYENGAFKEEGEYFIPEQKMDPNYKIINFWNVEGKQTVVNGEGMYDFRTDKVSEIGNIKNGFKDGEWKFSESKSKSRFVEIYDKGRFVSGIAIDKDGNKKDYLEIFKQPKPKKGDFNDFYKFIGKNFTITREATKNDIKGKILLKFVVEKEGQINDIEIIKGLGYGLDEEAIRVLKKYGDWIPGEYRGRKIRATYNLPIIISY